MKTLFLILFNVTIVLFQILSLIISILSGEMLKSNIVYISNVLDNWSSTPIKNIQLFDYDCPVNYEPLLVNKYSISCDFSLDRDFLDQKSSSPQLFKNSINQTFCEERYSDFFYFQIKQKKKCDSKKEKDCGILDTLGNHFCVHINSSCPINGIAIKHIEKELFTNSQHTYGKISQDNFNEYKLNYLAINNEYSLLTTNTHNDTSSFLVVDIDVILDRAKRNLNCRQFLKNQTQKILNHRIKSIDTTERLIQNKDSFLDKSDIFSFHDHLIDIEYRPYIGWKSECLHNKHSTPNNIEILYEKYKKLFDSKQKLTIFYIIFTLVVKFILIYFFSLHLNLKNSSQYFYLILTQIIFMFILIPLLYSDISIYLSYLNNKHSVDTYNCSDEINNGKLRQIKKNMNYNYILDCMLFFFLLVNLIISFIFIICLRKSVDGQNDDNDSS